MAKLSAALLLAAQLLLPTVAAVQKFRTPKSAPIVPGAYIVELDDQQDTASFFRDLESKAIPAKQRLELSSDLFKGVSFQFKDSAGDFEIAAAAVAELPNVKQLWPVRIYSVPKTEVVWTGKDSAIPSAGISKRAAKTTFSPHLMTQVDKLRAEGYTGKGIKVAIIDTGIDYTHPALGGCFGKGCLVSYGTDLVGDGYDGSNTPVPDDDPMDQCEGHGSHVAGIVAAQSNPLGFTGAAPDVTLGAYRVFGCGGSAGNDVLIAAYLKAYKDGSDIITASIGGPSGWSEDPWAVAVERIVKAGVPCTVSAGNDGAEGIFYASTAANGKGVMAIASVDNVEAPMYLINGSFTANGVSDTFGWAEGAPSEWGNLTLPLISIGTDPTDPANACTALPDSTPDLSNYIVLVRRGTCAYTIKAANVVARGAKYILFYNNVAGIVSVTTTSATPGLKGVGMVTAEQGVEWVKLLAAGANVTVTISDPKTSTRYVESPPNTSSGGFLSTFTSWGPTYELDVKPQFGAPGGMILSTYPQALGSYAVLSGTSMACPLAAAVVALIIDVRKTKDPKLIENLLSATANPNVFYDGKAPRPYLAPVPQQGGGLIQAYDAAHAETILSLSSISFNDTEHRVKSAKFTIKNTGKKTVTYSFGNQGAATAYTFAKGSIFPAAFPNELLPSYASIKFSTQKTSVSPGASTTITVSSVDPAGLDASRIPVWSGYLTLNASNGESLSIPYQGVTGNLRSVTVLDTAYVSLSPDADLNPIPANTTFTIPKSKSFVTGVTYPKFVGSLAFGSALVKVEVVPVGARRPEALGQLFGYPNTYLPRGAWTTTWNGQLDNGKFVPAGTYKLVVKALHVFGNPKNDKDYDMTETDAFTLKYTS